MKFQSMTLDLFQFARVIRFWVFEEGGGYGLKGLEKVCVVRGHGEKEKTGLSVALLT